MLPDREEEKNVANFDFQTRSNALKYLISNNLNSAFADIDEVMRESFSSPRSA